MKCIGKSDRKAESQLVKATGWGDLRYFFPRVLYVNLDSYFVVSGGKMDALRVLQNNSVTINKIPYNL